MKTKVEVITADCEYYNKIAGENKMFPKRLELKLDEHNDKWHSLYYDGEELFFGNLNEINAIVKSLIRKYEIDNDIDHWEYVKKNY